MVLSKVVACIDADGFETQLYQLLPQWIKTKGYPTLVYWVKTGRIVSMSPEAKQAGISRDMKVDQAKLICPGLYLIPKKVNCSKPDTSFVMEYTCKIRDVVMEFREELLQQYGNVNLPIEKSGSDEFFLELSKIVDVIMILGHILQLDTTRKLIIEGKDRQYSGQLLSNRNNFYFSVPENWDDEGEEEVHLIWGAKLLCILCDKIFDKVGIVCSGGVGSNRGIAKLACKINKPAAITAMTMDGFYRVSSNIGFREMPGFGGDLGQDLASISGNVSLEQMRCLVDDNHNYLIQQFGREKADRARNLVHGLMEEPVQMKLKDNGMNCGKKGLEIHTKADYRRELNYLAQNAVTRLEDEARFNKRIATHVSVQYFYWTGSQWRKHSCPMNIMNIPWHDYPNGRRAYDQKAFIQEAMDASINRNAHFVKNVQNINEINFRMTQSCPTYGD